MQWRNKNIRTPGWGHMLFAVALNIFSDTVPGRLPISATHSWNCDPVGLGLPWLGMPLENAGSCRCFGLSRCMSATTGGLGDEVQSWQERIAQMRFTFLSVLPQPSCRPVEFVNWTVLPVSSNFPYHWLQHNQWWSTRLSFAKCLLIGCSYGMWTVNDCECSWSIHHDSSILISLPDLQLAQGTRWYQLDKSPRNAASKVPHWPQDILRPLRACDCLERSACSEAPSQSWQGLSYTACEAARSRWPAAQTRRSRPSNAAEKQHLGLLLFHRTWLGFQLQVCESALINFHGTRT